ncbi:MULTISPECIES: DUF1798 family protein [unclassified Virgibacillus]|uniref:DUF1798 family protein n=1 Tax=unclassified Virgibacillus TaxID=2620237 RepID=UPI0024DE8ACA|nr:DUF1798 family protein [Virgibacillus sp. LDC-1]
MELMIQTTELLKHIDQLKDNYEHNDPPQNQKDKDFFHYVKEATLPVYNLIDDWESNALTFLKTKQSNVHPQQIMSTRDNLELLLMHSYYIDVRRKRYMELYQSICYVLDNLVQDIEVND